MSKNKILSYFSVRYAANSSSLRIMEIKKKFRQQKKNKVKQNKKNKTL